MHKKRCGDVRFFSPCLSLQFDSICRGPIWLLFLFFSSRSCVNVFELVCSPCYLALSPAGSQTGLLLVPLWHSPVSGRYRPVMMHQKKITKIIIIKKRPTVTQLFSTSAPLQNVSSIATAATSQSNSIFLLLLRIPILFFFCQSPTLHHSSNS